MLHECVGDQNEVAGNPTSKRDRNRSGKMRARSQSFLAPDQRTDERALEKECEHSFHRQRLANYSAGIFGKVCPIRSKLEFHRNAGDDTDREIESEDLRPKPDSLVVFFITGPQ